MQQKVLITGATGGLGQQVAIELVKLGAAVVIHGRDADRVAATREKVAAYGSPVSTVVADLASIAEVRRLAAEVAERHPDLTVLVNNAGVGFGRPGEGRQVSRDGIELRFAVNYLASHLLARELLPTLTRNAPARIVNVASVGQAPFADDPLLERDYDGVRAYRQSKLAMIADTFVLAAEAPGVTVNALHPASLMPTGMVIEAGWHTMDSVDTGVRSTLRLIVDPELDGVTGRYFDKLDESEPLAEARDPHAQAVLADLSAKLLAR
jgi:NAD(P)-dependent dehydrogenase (short-subunit alcohol dehydrogenase family)